VVSPLILLASLVGVTLLLVFAYRVFDVKKRIHYTWGCGYRTCAKTQYSATGFAGPIRRFFNWLYKAEEHFSIQKIGEHETKFSDSSYEVHVKPLFEVSLYDNSKKITNIISYWVYRLAHFEKTRYSAMIFNLILMVLFSYRIFFYGFSWASLAVELVVMSIFVKLLIIGDKR